MLVHLKRRVGVISAAAVMAALLPVLTASVATAIPATALVPKTVDDVATYSACPAGSAAASGFTDTTSTDVDCIAMHGITTGVTATTYEPTANVPRWQMALYLTRMATSAGVTLGSGADQGFTDISGYSAAIQTGINQIKQLGVTVGKTATTYAPDDNVTREEMAMFLDRALATMPAGPGGISAASGNSLLGVNVNSDSTGTGEYNYDDIDGGSVTFEGHNSIVEVYQLGITGDASTVRAFNPSGAITRASMATWVTNALAHTNARPAGLWLQASKTSGFANTAPTLSASYRDSSRNPVSGTVVDMFEWTNSVALADNSTTTAAGACATNVRITGNSLTKCKVEVGDPTTDTQGNISAVTVGVTNGKTESFYAWTAAAGTTFANATHASGTDYSTVNVSSTTPASILLMSTDAPAGAAVAGSPYATTVKYGTTVTITAQMSAAAIGGVYAAVAQPLNKVTFVHTIEAVAADTVESVTTTSVFTDANGTATYSFTDADPSAAAATGDTTHSIVVTDNVASVLTSAAALTTQPGHFMTTGSTVEFDFTDDAIALTSSTMATNLTSYAAGSALLPVARSATITLLDQYGNAHAASAGASVQFTGPSVGRLASTAAGSETMTFAAAPGLDVGDKVVITELGATPQTLKEDCTLTVKTRTDATAFIFKTVAGDQGVGASLACNADAADPFLITGGDISGAGAGAWLVNRVHDTFGFAERTIGPDGTTSIAWNDVNTTAGVSSSVGGYVSAALNAAPNKSTFRYLAPNAVVLDNSQTSSVWTTTAGSDLVDADDDIGAQILAWDNANNTLLVRIDYATGVCSLFSLLAGVGCPYTITQYTYDDNDQFNLTADATAVATSLAGFELMLASHQNANDGVGGAIGGFARGDLDTVSYQALSGNVSTFSLGG
jgi:hypothetical protein